MKHNVLSQEEIRQTSYNLRDFHAVDLLEKYYGEKKNSYVMVLNLMGGYGNFGRAFTHNGKTDLYAVVESSANAANMPVFAPSIALFTLVIHEFSHGFVNPAIDPYIATVEKDTALYEPVKSAMQAAGYYSWQATVYETVVPAAVVRMAALQYGEAFADKNFYRQLIGRRFIYADSLLKRLAWYETHRDQYTAFKSFVPELLSVFDHIGPKAIDSLQKKVEEYRKPDIPQLPKPYQFAKDSTTYFIVSTHEHDQQAQAGMVAWVKSYRGMICPNCLLITDDAALNMNLSRHDLVVFGTPEGNSFLSIYAGQLPIHISRGQVLTNKVIKGEHLQVVSAWTNPFDDRRAMVIYTAQQTADINNYNYSPYKDQTGYWIGENTITLDKGDYVNYWKVWECDPM